MQRFLKFRNRMYIESASFTWISHKSHSSKVWGKGHSKSHRGTTVPYGHPSHTAHFMEVHMVAPQLLGQFVKELLSLNHVVRVDSALAVAINIVFPKSITSVQKLQCLMHSFRKVDTFHHHELLRDNDSCRSLDIEMVLQMTNVLGLRVIPSHLIKNVFVQSILHCWLTA